MNSPARSIPSLVLVTGASGGIGAELAAEYARRGHDLVLTARSRRALDAVAETLRASYGVRIDVLPEDLADAAGAARVAAHVLAEDRPLAAVVNNAGYGLYGDFSESDLDDTLRMMRLNMEAPVVLTRRLLPRLRATRGHVLNVASTAAFQPGPTMAVYYATKAFLLSWSEALAEELAGSGITVTALCPGPTASGFQERADMRDSALVKGRRLPTAAAVAAFGARAAFRGRRLAIHGVMNWAMAQSVRFTPRRVVTALVAYWSRRR